MVDEVDTSSPDEKTALSWRSVSIAAAVFGLLVLVLQRGLRTVCERVIEFDCPYYWPLSVFNPRLPAVRDIVVALAVTALFYLFLRVLEARRFDPRLVLPAACLLILGTTLIQGVAVGFYAPVAGDAQTGVLVPDSPNGQEYYHDALGVTGAADFLARYNEIQPTLHRHSHTHPPGAVLSFYFLSKVLGDPSLIGIAIMLVGSAGTVFFAYRIFRTAFTKELSGYMTFLLMILPAIQIYYLATLDTLVAALLTASLYFFCFSRSRLAGVAAAALTTASFLLTFVTLFIFPVLVGFEILVKRSVRRSLMLVGGVLGFHLLIYLLTGYNAWQSFRTASAFENSAGFMLFAEPANYLFTRLEDIGEFVFFFGPFLTVLAFKGWGRPTERPLNVLAALAVLTMGAMFVTGAFRTGETVRPCMFLFPYLLFPVGHWLEDRGVGRWGRAQLASLVFGQALVMQLFGNYFW